MMDRGPRWPTRANALPILQAGIGSWLPAGKTWETFEHDRVPLALRQQLDHLAQGSFVERGVNVLAFGLPGTGKTHALCALGTVWWKPATPSSSLRPTAWCTWPPSGCQAFSCSWTTLPQGAEESEVLFTLIAGYITSNVTHTRMTRFGYIRGSPAGKTD